MNNFTNACVLLWFLFNSRRTSWGFFQSMSKNIDITTINTGKTATQLNDVRLRGANIFDRNLYLNIGIINSNKYEPVWKVAERT